MHLSGVLFVELVVWYCGVVSSWLSGVFTCSLLGGIPVQVQFSHCFFLVLGPRGKSYIVILCWLLLVLCLKVVRKGYAVDKSELPLVLGHGTFCGPHDVN